MSRQIVLIRTKNNNEKFSDIKDENIIPFNKSEVVDVIKRISYETGVICRYTDTDFPILEHHSWSIEFQFLKTPDVLWLWVKGNEEPVYIFHLIKKYLNSRLFDMYSESFIEENDIQFIKWQKHVDKILKTLNNR